MKIQRHLAPTAAPVSLADLWRACLGLLWGDGLRVQFESEIKQYFKVKHVFCLSSGKAALAIIIRALAGNSSRRKVIIPSYTCFSVPSAIVRAGCKVVLCDVDPHTLDFVFADLEKIVDRDTLCIVIPHLLGQPANIRKARAIVEPYGVTIIEDAAQAMGGLHDHQLLGTQGDVGIFSLGRGKNVTAGSGGVIVTNSDSLAYHLSALCQKIPEPTWPSRAANFLVVVAMKVLIHPQLYWLPAGLPFLGLGETKFCPDFSINLMDGVRASFLATWRQRLETSNERRAQNASRYLCRFKRYPTRLEPALFLNGVYLRLPVIMPTAEGKQKFSAIADDQGFGVSGLYPSPISEIPELRASFEQKRFPGASMLAERMVTLPVHQYVRQADIDKICGTLEAIIARSAAPAVEGQEQLGRLA